MALMQIELVVINIPSICLIIVKKNVHNIIKFIIILIQGDCTVLDRRSWSKSKINHRSMDES